MSERAARAAILCVGDELTEGRTLDRHGKYLAELLTELGAEVDRVALIPDRLDAYRREFSDLIPRVGTLLVTGGLGPTSDDLTREAVAEAAQVGLEFRDDVWRWLQERFRGRRLSESNRKQALVPSGFDIIPNQAGTAPGFAGEIDGCMVIALPGPPAELRRMVDGQVRGFLQERLQVPAAQIQWLTAFGVPESELEESLRRCADPGIRWGTNVEEFRILVALRDGTAEVRRSFFRRLQEELGGDRLVEGQVRIGEVIRRDLEAAGEQLMCVESCTGGLITKLITDVPGSSAVFWGGITAYSYEAKERLLGVQHETLERYGAVSEETAREMALGGVRRSGAAARVAVSVTGIAGPGGGTEEKPVGTVWLAVAIGEEIVRTRRVFLPRGRDRIRRWSAVNALLLLREALRAGPLEAADLTGRG
ncbi:MAG: CinA family nicotinamide mononucleotide deamidase-related protein [Spirochaetaceae bacterium]